MTTRRSGLRRGQNQEAPALRARELTTETAAAAWGRSPRNPAGGRIAVPHRGRTGRCRGGVLVGEHPGQLQENPGHPQPGVAKERGERTEPPQGDPWSG